MVLGTFGTVFAEETGSSSEKIDWLVKQGIVQGTSQGLELDKTVDRATVARLVAVALNEEAAAESLKLVPSGFVDMNTAHWANGYAALANGRGYMVGNAKREFMPSKSTTYAEVLSVLVRVSLGRDLTDAEKAGAITWYAPYVAKAAELGITEGVSVGNVGADAVRKDVLEMLYNVLTSKSHGRYDVYKAIVLENSRVSKLSADEIVVEVIEKVKTAQYVEESRKEGRGSQLTLKIDPEVIDNKLATPENLLGRVADFTVTKDGKVVEVKIDESYKIVSGDFTAERNNMVKGSARYAVNLPERYYADRDRERYDETIFRTYYNNRSYSYEDFYNGKAEDSANRKDSFDVEYARVTVKDGKVLLINAFGFDDIAPVKEVNKDGEVVIVYNDARDGATKRYEISASANLIFVNDGVLSKGARKDIAVDNVIHEYKGGFIVKQDKPVTGKFEKVSQDKYNDVYVHVAGESYYVSDTKLKQGVYEFEANKNFYTLTPENAHNDLRTFRDETVKLVTALDDSVQYIGSEVDLGEFVGIATRIVGKDLRVLRNDKKTYDYEANLDTVVIADGSTGHKGLNSIEKHSLVFVRANDKTLNRVRDFGRPEEKITTFDTVKKIVTKSGEYKILDETEVFVINKDNKGNEYVEVRKIKDVQDAWKDLKSEDDKAKVKVNVLSEYDYFKESSRYDKSRDKDGSSKIAVALVFSDIKIATDTTRIYGEFRGYNDRQGKELDIRTADGEPMTVKLSSLDLVTDKLESGDILRLEQTKGDDKEITDLQVVIRTNKNHKEYETYKVKSANRYNEITLENGPTITKDRATKIFGNEPVEGDVIAFAEYEKGHDDYEENYAIVIKNFGSRGTVKNGSKPVETSNVVTYTIGDAAAKVTLQKDANVAEYAVLVTGDDAGTGVTDKVVTIKADGFVNFTFTNNSMYTVKLVKLSAPTTVISSATFITNIAAQNITTLKVVDANVVSKLVNPTTSAPTTRTIDVAYNTTAAQLLAAIEPTQEGATLKVLGAAGGLTVPSATKLATGMVVEVTAKDTTTVAEYVITVKAGNVTTLKVVDAYVVTKLVNTANLEEVTVAYDTTVAQLLASIAPVDAKATVKVLTAAGAAEAAKTAKVTATMVVEVTAQDDTTSVEYDIVVEPAPTKSTDTTLKSLDLNKVTVDNTTGSQAITIVDTDNIKTVADLLAVIKTVDTKATIKVLASTGGYEVAGTEELVAGMVVKVIAEDTTVSVEYAIN
jgi:hypothetical protein